MTAKGGNTSNLFQKHISVNRRGTKKGDQERHRSTSKNYTDITPFFTAATPYHKSSMRSKCILYIAKDMVTIQILAGDASDKGVNFGLKA